MVHLYRLSMTQANAVAFRPLVILRASITQRAPSATITTRRHRHGAHPATARAGGTGSLPHKAESGARLPPSRCHLFVIVRRHLHDDQRPSL